MGDFRNQKLIIAFGKKGVGKTYKTYETIKSYVSGFNGQVKPRKVLVIDVNNEYSREGKYPLSTIALDDVAKFSVSNHVEARRISPFKPDGTPYTIAELQKVLAHCLYFFRGGLLLLEDISRYVQDNMTSDLMGAIATNRHRDVDIIIHLQSIGRVTPKFWQNVTDVRFHKITDSVERHKNKYPDFYELFKIAENIVNNEYKSGNKHFSLYVDCEEAKIRFNDKKKAMVAIEDFTMECGNTLIKPLLNRVKKDGSPEFTRQSAMKYKVDSLYNEYF